MSGMTLNVDENLVKPIIEAEIQTAIVRQLQSSQNLIPKLVQAALNEKVTYDGKRSSSSYDNKYPYIEWLCNNAIQNAAAEAMKEFIAANVETLKLEVAKQIMAQRKDISKIFVEGITQSIKSHWAFKVEIALPDQNK